jgi:2-oxoglutarate dehydrogenase E2 component (dihydrolipoamide succinyltransferase)
MAVDIKVPPVGESITEGTLSRWLKKDGDVVRAGDPVCELETEKATSEVPAPATGRLVITAREGQTVPIGAVIGRIEEGVTAAKPEPDQAPRDEKGTPAVARSAAPLSAVPGPVSPAARRLASEERVDTNQVRGTGRGGLITKEDVVNYLEQRPKPAPETTQAPLTPQPPLPQRGEGEPDRKTPTAPALLPPLPSVGEGGGGGEGAPQETRQRMSSIRQRIAERLVAAQAAAAILTTFNEADLSGVMALRARYKDAFQKKHGVGLGLISFFVKAAVEALKAFPLVNSRIEGPAIVTPHYYHIGVAVSTEKGLLVPVLRHADRLSFAGIEKGIAALAEKARAGKITVDDLQGGTFTITNGGVFGSLLSTPLLNPPQSGILGMHTIQKRPVVVEDQVVIRPMMYLALSYDHRLIDGREAVSFLVRIKECVEDPERLLLEV